MHSNYRYDTYREQPTGYIHRILIGYWRLAPKRAKALALLALLSVLAHFISIKALS
jgi:hypothetical protein